MLYSIFEEYKVHLVAIGAVVVLKHSCEYLHELVSVLDFLIELDRSLKLEEVSKHDLLLDEDSIMLHVHSETSVEELTNQVSEPGLVIVIDKTIEEHTLGFIHPQLGQGLRALNRDWLAHKDALEYLRYVSQVEEVMEFCGCRSKLLSDSIVDFNCTINQSSVKLLYGVLKTSL
jgi:hypothetical protein